MSSGFNFFTNAVLKTPATGSWQDVSVVDNGVPEGATGVILDLTAPDLYQAKIHARAKGSVQNFDAQLQDNHISGAFIKLDANRVFQAYRDAVTCEVYVKGYTDGTVEFLTDFQELAFTPQDAYQDMDVSAYVPLGAKGVILFIHNTSGGNQFIGARGNGSTWDVKGRLSDDVYAYHFAPLDANRIFEFYSNHANCKVYLVGWFKSNCPVTFKITPPNVTQDNIGEWQDRDLIAETFPDYGADGALMWAGVSGGWYSAGMRKDGSSDTYLNSLYYHRTARGVGLGEFEIYEGYKSDASVVFYLLAYFMPLIITEYKYGYETYTLIEEGVPLNILMWKEGEEIYTLIEESLLDMGALIEGVTRDASGVPLANCELWLFRTSDKAFIKTTVSDGDGEYSFAVLDDVTEYFIRSHKDAPTRVFGTTDRNIKGVKVT